MRGIQALAGIQKNVLLLLFGLSANISHLSDFKLFHICTVGSSNFFRIFELTRVIFCRLILDQKTYLENIGTQEQPVYHIEIGIHQFFTSSYELRAESLASYLIVLSKFKFVRVKYEDSYLQLVINLLETLWSPPTLENTSGCFSAKKTTILIQGYLLVSVHN